MKSLITSFLLICTLSTFAFNKRQDPFHGLASASTFSIIGQFQKMRNQAQSILINEQKIISQIDFAMVCHKNLILLEYIDLEDDFDAYTEIEDYPLQTNLYHLYELEDPALIEKYQNLMNTTVYLNDHFLERYQLKQKIVDIVIVNEIFQKGPYIAAVTDVNVAHDIYYCWASSSQSDLEIFGQKRTTQFQYLDELNSNESSLLKLYQDSENFVDMDKKMDESKDENAYSQIEITSFKSSSGIFYVLENKLIGTCEFITENHINIYKKDKDEFVLLGDASVDKQFIDLIDIDKDGVPELLCGEFASSVIYEINGHRLTRIKSASWSSNSCPC